LIGELPQFLNFVLDENVTQCSAFLLWFVEKTLILVDMDLKLE
jgi:hypothetical protein